MATHDYVIDNGTGAAVRTDINNVLQAIASNNSGSSAPSTTYAFQFFADTQNNVMKIRNAANNDYIELFQLDGTFTLEDGSASTPALAFRDDLNTGIFSSAADTFEISTGGTRAMTIDSSQRVLIGTTTEGASTADNLTIADSGNSGITIRSGTSNTGAIFFSDATTGSAEFAGNIIYTHGNETLDFNTNGSLVTPMVRINSSGNVGIAKENPQAKLDVDGSAIFRSTLALFDDTLAADSSSGTENRIKIGNGGDLQLFHDGRSGKNNSVIRSLSGDLQINAGNSAGNVEINLKENVAGETKELSAKFIQDGAVELYFNGQGPKLQTLSTGVSIDNKLGIGTTSPSATLHCVGGEIFFGDSNSGANSTAKLNYGGSSGVLNMKSSSSSGNTSIKFHTCSSGTEALAMTIDSSGNMQVSTGQFTVGTTASTGLQFINDGTFGTLHSANLTFRTVSATRMTIDTSGNIGAPSGTNIHNASDSRVKKNVVDIDKGLSSIKSLRPVSFNWIDGFCDAEKDTLYGFIAQEVQSVDSNLIQNFSEEIIVDGNKIENVLRVNEKFIIPMLVKAIQELSAKVEALEAA